VAAPGNGRQGPQHAFGNDGHQAFGAGGPARLADRRPDLCLGPPQFAQSALRAPQQHVARLRQRHAAGGALEQRDAQDIFELLHGPRHGRLRQMDGLGRAVHVAVPGHGLEDT